MGHVTNDVLAAGLTPGGSALYASITAARLGAQARAVTSHGPDFCGLAALAAAGVTVVQGAAPRSAPRSAEPGGRPRGGGPRTTTFINEYDADGTRHARVLAVAEPLTEPTDADVVLACPVIGEVAPSVLAGGLVGAGLQGWLRRLDSDSRVQRHVPADVGFLAPCRAVFCSVEDLGDAATLLPRLRAVVPIVVVTDGARGALIHAEGAVRAVAAYPTVEVDPTGAGDVFATAFLLALARGESLESAGVFAACAASIVVEGVGPATLHRVQEAEQRRVLYNDLTAGD